MIRLFCFLLMLMTCGLISVQGQVDRQPNSARIYEDLLKLRNTATVMYVAAHPDDENTRLISWLSNHMRVNTVYLSLTRGDGGQNLIGTEKGPLLGLLRTQELLQARRIDGGQQFFSRANDFGYSKTATETREIWEEEEIMSDVVWAIRTFQPDILINRFDHNSNGRTHGHHTFSAIASLEAFDLSGDENQFPEQLKYVSPWQPRRVFFNTSWWFYGSRENFEKADKSKMVSVDVGEYYPIRGISNNEIASQSRSMHKCQGFGSAARRGSQEEYLELLKGDSPVQVNGQIQDIFDGIDMTWTRIPDGKIINDKIDAILNDFNFSMPSASLPALVDLRKSMELIVQDDNLKNRKLPELYDIIKSCAAIYVEATTSDETIVPGDSITLEIEMINRSDIPVSLKSLTYYPAEISLKEPIQLNPNENISFATRVKTPVDIQSTSPYWLDQKQDNIGMYIVEDQKKIGLPETPHSQYVGFRFQINDHTFDYDESIVHKYTDPAVGEIYQPLVVSPPVTITMPEPVYLLSNGQSTNITVEVRSHSERIEGEAKLDIGPGWKIEPESIPFDISRKGDKRVFQFNVTPPTEEVVTTVNAYAVVNDKKYNSSLAVVEYDHIPKQTAFLPSKAVIEHLKINIPTMRVGYISGAGDVIPQSLRQLGIVVDEINVETASFEQLKQYKSIVVGIRAFNTINELSYFTDDLWKYVEEGGNVIVQYNTNRRLKADVAPIPLTLSRDRITEEDAELNMLNKEHPVFMTPNQIQKSDFDGWVQERGLYFANEWDDAFVPLLSGHDTGEDDKMGMLLVAPYGKGNYVYTGISFFRQLPAGVPGAYRLFINLLSMQNNRP